MGYRTFRRRRFVRRAPLRARVGHKRKRYSVRRPVYKRRRVYRKKRNTQFISAVTEIEATVQTVPPGTGLASNGVFSLNSANVNATITRRIAMFQFYRIRSVEVIFDFPDPNRTVYGYGSAPGTIVSGAGCPPQFYFAFNPGVTSSSPGTVDDIMMLPGVVNMLAVGRKKFTVRPHALPEYYEGPASTGYGKKISPWLSTSDPNVPHFGYVTYLNNGNTASYATTTNFRVTYRYHIDFKELQQDHTVGESVSVSDLPSNLLTLSKIVKEENEIVDEKKMD